MVWFENKTSTCQRCNVLNDNSPTNCGRWISRDRKDGRSRLDLCRFSTITVAISSRWPPNGSTHGEPVREQLEEAFQRCGVPEGMLMDHGTPWWGHQSPSGHTHLSLWLMRQGIHLHWSGIRHPQTQGKVERFHGSLQRALARRGFPGQHLQAWLDDYPLGTQSRAAPRSAL